MLSCGFHHFFIRHFTNSRSLSGQSPIFVARPILPKMPIERLGALFFGFHAHKPHRTCGYRLAHGDWPAFFKIPTADHLRLTQTGADQIPRQVWQYTAGVGHGLQNERRKLDNAISIVVQLFRSFRRTHPCNGSDFGHAVFACKRLQSTLQTAPVTSAYFHIKTGRI